MSAKNSTERVSGPSRVLAWIAALIMAPALCCAAFGWIGLQLATDQGLHERIGLDDSVISGQMEELSQLAEELGETYEFDPAMVRETLDRETVTELNRQVIAWWTGMAVSGVPEEMPVWDGEALQERLTSDEAFLEIHGALARDTAGRVIAELNAKMSRMMFPLREQLITEGMKVIRRRAALSELLSDARRIPPALTLLSLAMAGCVMLLTARDLRTSRRMIGAALGSAGILSICGLGLYWMLNLGMLTRESSVRLSEQVSRLERLMTIEAAVVIAVLFAGAWLCLRRLPADQPMPDGGEPA